MKLRVRWLLACSLVACGGEPGRVPAPAASKPVVLAHASPLEASEPPPLSTASIYDLPVIVVDRTGTARPLASFRGSPLLLTMFYGSCAAACPLLTSDLKRIEAKLSPATRARVRVLMVSFDQARDTPPVLARLTLERGMDPTRWTLASANDDDARSLAGVLGIRYRKLDSGEFYHSSSIVLVDGAGLVRARLDGLGNDVTPILSALDPPS